MPVDGEQPCGLFMVQREFGIGEYVAYFFAASPHSEWFDGVAFAPVS